MDTDDYLQCFSSVEILPPSLSALIALIGALLLLCASAFISSSEIAFFSLSPQDKQEIDEEEDNRDTTIKSLLARSEYLLATILIGNNLVNVAVVVLLSYFMTAIFVLSPLLDFVLQSVILTFLLLLFGEIMPKIYASHNTLKTARRAASPLASLQHLFRPLANLLVNSTQLVNRFVSPRNNNISIDEISQALKMTDVQESEEKELLEGIVTFGDKTVEAVMTPRVDMVDIDIETDFVTLMAYIVEHGYSRVPVYEDNEDSIKGILYIKDLLPHLKEDATFAWQSLLRAPYFVPENKRIDNLLEEFRTEKTHMAIVVDEFGGTCGLITMEDIIEEIVGEISDEYDEEERQYRKLDENNFIFEGKILLNDFFRITGIDESNFEKVSEDSETLAGLILEIKEDFPKQKEHICYDRYKFIVLELNNRRITKVKLCILPEEETL